MMTGNHVVAIALFVGLAIVVQMNDNVDLHPTIGGPRSANTGSSVEGRTRAASSVLNVAEHAARMGSAQELVSARVVKVKKTRACGWPRSSRSARPSGGVSPWRSTTSSGFRSASSGTARGSWFLSSPKHGSRRWGLRLGELRSAGPSCCLYRSTYRPLRRRTPCCTTV